MKTQFPIIVFILILSGCTMINKAGSAYKGFSDNIGEKMPTYNEKRCEGRYFCFTEDSSTSTDNQRRPYVSPKASGNIAAQSGGSASFNPVQGGSPDYSNHSAAYAPPPQIPQQSPPSYNSNGTNGVRLIPIPPPPPYGTTYPDITKGDLAPPMSGMPFEQAPPDPRLKPWEANPEWKKDLPEENSEIKQLKQDIEW